MDRAVTGTFGRAHLAAWAGAWLLLCALLVYVGWEPLGARAFDDPDDALRLVQVRDLLAGQGWFDLRQYRIDPPLGTPMHWSRLVDLPIAGTIRLLQPLLGYHAAESAALVLVPLLTLGVAMLGIARVAARFFRTEVVALACVLCVLQPIFLAQLRVMRIDHHGWQAALLALALAALLPRRGARGAWLAGLAMAAGLMISIELLPMAGAFALVLFLRWLRDPAERGWLVRYLGGLAGGLFVLFALTRGPSALAPWCDAIAPAHLGFFAIVAAGAALAARRPDVSRPVLVGLFALTGAAGLGLFAWIAPNCLAAPFGELDPLVHRFWYRNVLEGQPAWRQDSLAISAMLQALVAVAATVHLWRKGPPGDRGWWRDHLLLLLLSIAGAMLVWRSMAFVAVFATVPLAWLADRMILRIHGAPDMKRRLATAAALIVALMPNIPVSAVEKAIATAKGDAPKEDTQSTCALERHADKLAALPPQTIFAIFDVGPTLLERTPHAVVATSHHRANLAMRDVIRAFLSPEEQARTIVQGHKATLLVICSDIDEPRIYARAAPGGLMADLLAGRVPGWLERVDLGTPSALRIYRVRQP